MWAPVRINRQAMSLRTPWGVLYLVTAPACDGDDLYGMDRPRKLMLIFRDFRTVIFRVRWPRTWWPN
jgi:hypothetical protein